MVSGIHPCLLQRRQHGSPSAMAGSAQQLSMRRRPSHGVERRWPPCAHPCPQSRQGRDQPPPGRQLGQMGGRAVEVRDGYSTYIYHRLLQLACRGGQLPCMLCLVSWRHPPSMEGREDTTAWLQGGQNGSWMAVAEEVDPGRVSEWFPKYPPSSRDRATRPRALAGPSLPCHTFAIGDCGRGCR